MEGDGFIEKLEKGNPKSKKTGSKVQDRKLGGGFLFGSILFHFAFLDSALPCLSTFRLSYPATFRPSFTGHVSPHLNRRCFARALIADFGRASYLACFVFALLDQISCCGPGVERGDIEELKFDGRVLRIFLETLGQGSVEDVGERLNVFLSQRFGAGCLHAGRS